MVELIPRQIHESFFLNWGIPFMNFGLYFFLMKSAQLAFSLLPNFQIHLKRRALFFADIFPKPRPSLSFSFATVSQASLCIFLLSILLPHKNQDCMPVILRATVFGMQKMDIQQRGMAEITLLIKIALPAIDNSHPFQELSLPQICEGTGFHMEILLGLAPRGSPKYLIRKESHLHLRTPEIPLAYIPLTFTPTKLLLWKLTLSSEHKLNHRNILLAFSRH